MLEMATLETRIFKIFWGSMTQTPPRKLAPTALVVPTSPHPLKDPGYFSITVANQKITQNK